MSINIRPVPPVTEQTVPASVPTRRAPSVRQRRRPALIGLGVALVALGGVGSAYLATQGRETHSVVVLRQDVPAGQQISVTDLATTTFTGTTDAATVPASQISSLVGKYAATTLYKGSVLNDHALVTELSPGKGRSIIGIGLKPTQQPTSGLVGGQAVRLVVTAVGQQPAQAQTVEAPKEWQAVVVRVGSANPDGTRTVDFDVAAEQAAQAVAAAGSGAISVVVDGQR